MLVGDMCGQNWVYLNQMSSQSQCLKQEMLPVNHASHWGVNMSNRVSR